MITRAWNKIKEWTFNVVEFLANAVPAFIEGAIDALMWW